MFPFSAPPRSPADRPGPSRTDSNGAGSDRQGSSRPLSRTPAASRRHSARGAGSGLGTGAVFSGSTSGGSRARRAPGPNRCRGSARAGLAASEHGGGRSGERTPDRKICLGIAEDETDQLRSRRKIQKGLPRLRAARARRAMRGRGPCIGVLAFRPDTRTTGNQCEFTAILLEPLGTARLRPAPHPPRMRCLAARLERAPAASSNPGASPKAPADGSMTDGPMTNTPMTDRKPRERTQRPRARWTLALRRSVAGRTKTNPRRR